VENNKLTTVYSKGTTLAKKERIDFSLSKYEGEFLEKSGYKAYHADGLKHNQVLLFKHYHVMELVFINIKRKQVVIYILG
jgi:hypothetical protein